MHPRSDVGHELRKPEVAVVLLRASGEHSADNVRTWRSRRRNGMQRRRMNHAQRSELLEEAVHAKKNAFARFSNYAVGSAVLTKRGRVYRGRNIENTSYGLTVCA